MTHHTVTVTVTVACQVQGIGPHPYAMCAIPKVVPNSEPSRTNRTEKSQLLKEHVQKGALAAPRGPSNGYDHQGALVEIVLRQHILPFLR